MTKGKQIPQAVEEDFDGFDEKGERVRDIAGMRRVASVHPDDRAMEEIELHSYIPIASKKSPVM